MSSLDRIVPFIRPIEPLLRDVTVTEVMVNAGGRHVFVERNGALDAVVDLTLDPRHLTAALKNIARACNDEISEAQPILDARLEDGSRVAAMVPPCAVDGPLLTIRKFTRRYTLDELVELGSVTPSQAECLLGALAAEQNILFAGATGSGKTALLNAVADHIPPSERIILIEDTAEIYLQKPNLVRMEARRPQLALGDEPPLQAVTTADLLRATLRHRPDRVIVGEVRGGDARFDGGEGEAAVLLQALNQGHKGSLSTIHANSAAQALARFGHCVVASNVRLPHRSVREAIGLAIHLVVHLVRESGRRRVADIALVKGYSRVRDRFVLECATAIGRGEAA